jgi:glycosyltransferase involved in cell wall biosynthesis
MKGPISQPVVIGWQVGVPSGWGTYGLNLALQLSEKDVDTGLPFLAKTLNLSGKQSDLLAPVIVNRERFRNAAGKIEGQAVAGIFLRALGDGLDFPPFLEAWSADLDIGVVFFESADVPIENLQRAAGLKAVITGSQWNTDVLRAAGLNNVFNCPQGIDSELFCPGEATGRFNGRFAVFSGGKLEYRKGQDLVIAAFKQFHQRHPDAVLVTAWQNPWPEAADSLKSSPHISGVPRRTEDGALNIKDWVLGEGLAPDSFIDLGALTNAEMPAVLREMDVAIFPSRCEGGTNLVAMEAMACGVPSILSRNTGHLDLFDDDTCYGIDLQIPLGEVMGRKDMQGWGESSIEEMVQKLELAYVQRDQAQRIASNGANFMKKWSWSAQVDRLLNVLSSVA